MRMSALRAAGFAAASFAAGSALNLGGYHHPFIAAVLLLVAVLLFCYSAVTWEPIHRHLYRARKAHPVPSLIAACVVGAITFGLWWWFLASPAALRETTDDLTGGDSFAYIVPQAHAGVNVLPLTIWNYGDHILSGVTVTIRNSRDFTNAPAFLAAPIITVGVLSPHGNQLLTAFLDPHPDATGIDYYIIEIRAQNGMVVQSLQIRKGTGSLQWAYRYNVTKTVLTQEKDGTTSGTPTMLLSQMQWSDDFTKP